MNASSQQAVNSTTSNNGGTTNNTNVNPWNVQEPYLQSAFGQAYGANNTAQPYLPSQLAAYASMLGYGTNTAVPTSSANAGATASEAGANGAAQGLYKLANYDPAIYNNASNVINTANQYVAGVNIPGQVAAAMQPAEIAAQYGTNPGIDATAAGSGNINSSRDAIEHALVGTNLGVTAANIGAQLQAGAYNTGANLGETIGSSNAANVLGAANDLGIGGGYTLNAGTGANTGSVGQATGLYGIANTGITGENNDPFAALQNYYNIIGGNNWGSSTSGATTAQNTANTVGTTTTTPSTLSQLGGWVNMLGSIL